MAALLRNDLAVPERLKCNFVTPGRLGVLGAEAREAGPFGLRLALAANELVERRIADDGAVIIKPPTTRQHLDASGALHYIPRA